MIVLLDFTIRVSIVLFVALSSLYFFRSQSAARRHAILSMAVFGALAFPIFSAVVPSWAIWQPALPAAAAPIPAVTAKMTAGPEMAETPIDSNTLKIGSIVVYAWITGLLAGVAVLSIGAIRLRRIARRATLIESGPWSEIADEISKLFALPRRVRLLQSDRPSMLVTWGVRRPKLILPLGALEWPRERIRVVLCHEFAHIRRCDWIAQVAAEVLRGLYWFNPLLWIACSRLRRESEHACDDAVLNLGIAGSDYAAQLLDLARILNKFDGAGSPVLAMARPSTLERRFAAMLNPRLNRTAISRSALAVTAIACLAVVLPVAVLQVSAQNSAARIHGTIVDPSGARMPGVLVSMINPQTRTKDVTSTDETGSFALFGLPAGQYLLQAAIAGFAEARSELSLEAGQDVNQDILLKVGALTEVVTVTAQRAIPPGTGLRVPPRRIRIGGNVQLAKLTAQAKPLYPQALRDAGVEGSVTLEGIVGTNGNILSLRPVSADARREFVEAATNAVSQWTYRPTLLNGEPVEVITTITVNFWLSQ